MTLSPGLNNPRFFNNSTRSKRFSTFRFVVIVLAPFRLRCCDIKTSQSERPDSKPELEKINFRFRARGRQSRDYLPGPTQAANRFTHDALGFKAAPAPCC